jgi:hypothetical protein
VIALWHTIRQIYGKAVARDVANLVCTNPSHQETVVGFYEKVIKVKADVAALLMFDFRHISTEKGPPLPRCVGGGRSVSASPLRSRSGTSGSGLGAFTLKENQPDLLREAERLTQESPTGVQEEPDREIRYWHLPEVDWPVADRQIRVVKTVRIEQQRRVTVRGKDAARIKGKTAILLPSTNFYATNFELGSISPLFIHQLSRSRWRIDTEVFQTITTDCHLKHPAVHQTTALVVLTMIRFLAYTPSALVRSDPVVVG